MKENKVIICGHGGGTPSTKNLAEYNEYRYKLGKGVVCVRRNKELAKSLSRRLKFKAKYKTILGRNVYSQTKREYVYKKYSNGLYYSDCSSSGMATMQEIGCKIPWLFNTAAIYESNLFEDVPVKIKDGHILNPEILKYGDCILYKGSDPSRPAGIGHVEYVYKK